MINHTGRISFLFALQAEWPDLWRSLKADVSAGGEDSELRDWAARQGRGLTDAGLLDCLRDTINKWAAYPEHPRSQLQPGGVCPRLIRTALYSLPSARNVVTAPDS